MRAPISVLPLWLLERLNTRLPPVRIAALLAALHGLQTTSTVTSLHKEPHRAMIDDRIEIASTLPSRFYTDAEHLAQEKTSIFNRTWQLVGRLAQVEEPGSYFTADVAGEPIVVVRDRGGSIRAFFNVCRHRAGPPACGAGIAASFKCGYHGWTYSLEGRLLGTPEFDGVECFNKSDFGLVPVEADVWEQFIFVRLNNGRQPGPSLLEYLEDIPSRVEGIGIARMSLIERRDYIINCNWKVYVDNYLEGYHIPIVHPGLHKELDYSKYRTITHRYYSLQDAPIRTNVDSSERLYVPTDSQNENFYFWLFPNLMVNINPDNTSTNLIIPLAADKTLTVFEWFAHTSKSSEAASETEKRNRVTIAFSEEIQQEDIRICEAVQSGLGSISYDRGRYSVKRENGVHHFHKLWSEFFGEN